MICTTSTSQLRSDKNSGVVPVAGELKAEKQDTYRNGGFRFWHEFKKITLQSFRGVNDPCLASDCRGETHSACYQNWIALNMRESITEDCLDPNGMPYGESYNWDEIRPKFDERSVADIDGYLLDEDNLFLGRSVCEDASLADYSCKRCTDCGACEDDPDASDYIKCIEEDTSGYVEDFSFESKPGQKVVYFEKRSRPNVGIDGAVYLYEPDFAHSADCQCEECQKLFEMVCEMTEEQIYWMMHDSGWKLPTKEETDDLYEEALVYHEERKLEELAPNGYSILELENVPLIGASSPWIAAGNADVKCERRYWSTNGRRGSCKYKDKRVMRTFERAMKRAGLNSIDILSGDDFESIERDTRNEKDSNPSFEEVKENFYRRLAA